MTGWVFEGWKFPSLKAEPPNIRFLKVVACPETIGYGKATVLFSHIPPGGTTGMHTHPGSDEIIHFTGRGEGTIDGEQVKTDTDSVMIAPAGVKHECRNTSETETLKLFCVFIPPLAATGLLAEAARKTKEYLESK